MLLLVLAQKIPNIPSEGHDGWYAGLVIGFAVVAAVVFLAAAILTYASRIAEQALLGIDKMDEARIATMPVWALQEINTSITGIWKAAQSARRILGEQLR